MAAILDAVLVLECYVINLLKKQGYEYNTSISSNSLNNNQWYIFFIYLKNRNKRHALGAKYPEYPTLHST